MSHMKYTASAVASRKMCEGWHGNISCISVYMYMSVMHLFISVTWTSHVMWNVYVTWYSPIDSATKTLHWVHAVRYTTMLHNCNTPYPSSYIHLPSRHVMRRRGTPTNHTRSPIDTESGRRSGASHGTTASTSWSVRPLPKVQWLEKADHVLSQY